MEINGLRYTQTKSFGYSDDDRVILPVKYRNQCRVLKTRIRQIRNEQIYQNRLEYYFRTGLQKFTQIYRGGVFEQRKMKKKLQ